MWFDVILSVANDLEPSWMGTSNITLWQNPRGKHFWAPTLELGMMYCPMSDRKLSQSWQKTEPIRRNALYFLLARPTTESTELVLKTVHKTGGTQPHLPWMMGRYCPRQCQLQGYYWITIQPLLTPLGLQEGRQHSTVTLLPTQARRE